MIVTVVIIRETRKWFLFLSINNRIVVVSKKKRVNVSKERIISIL